MKLVVPSSPYVASYLHALRGGWDWDDFFFGAGDPALTRATESTSALLAAFREDGVGTVRGGDGVLVPKLPSRHRWMWANGFHGSINLRWQPGTHDLPPTCLGHIGYGVLPESRRRGYASQALREMLPLAWAEGLEYVDIVTDPSNTASQRVVRGAGGRFVEQYELAAAAGGGVALRWRIFKG